MLYPGTLTKESTDIVIPEMSKYNVFIAILASSYGSGTAIGIRRDDSNIYFSGESTSGNNAYASVLYLYISGDTFVNFGNGSVWGASVTGLLNIRGIV